jgi:RNA polymerase sigma-70 factor, ECF subfamily
MHMHDSQVEDEDLLHQAMAGDKAAFGALYERYLAEIYRYVLLRVSDEREAEDITADTFLKTWTALPRLSKKRATIRSFRHWLYRVAKNLVIDYYRKRKPAALPEVLLSEGAWVGTLVEEHGQAQELARAIGQLSPDYQQILILRFVNDFSHADCAAVMGRTRGQTRVLQYRALKKLREIMDEASDA